MKKVELLFPDIITLTQFVVMHKVSPPNVDARVNKVEAKLTTREIAIACREYYAVVRN